MDPSWLVLVVCLCGFFAPGGQAGTFNSTLNGFALPPPFRPNALKVYGNSYYNPMTGVPLQGYVDEVGKLPMAVPKILFKGLPCACFLDSCGCCAGLNISAIKFDRTYCANFSFDMAQAAINMKVMMNENEIFNTSLSARNPPPICVPMPWIPILDLCLRFYDIKLPGSNIHTCVDFETRFAQSLLLVMHFDCVDVGITGVNWSKPGSYQNNTAVINSLVSAAAAAVHPLPVTEMYDDVDFEKPTGNSDGYAIGGPTLSPEDEDKIGEHRFTGQKRAASRVSRNSARRT